MRRPLLLGTLLACALAAAPAADAATKYAIRGRGFGHGVGMSQYGAYGLARHGASYRDILAHYYRGTQLSSAGSATIRVLLQQGRSKVLFTGASEASGHALDPDKTYYVRKAGLATYELRTSSGKKVETYSRPVEVSGDLGAVTLLGRALNGVTNGRYRGTIEIQEATFGGLVAVNAVRLDDYVQGVVPGEMPASWAPEALKAQAVAARTYALATDAGGALFDQYPDTRSQVYRGVEAEQPSANAAVRATAGQVLRYRGRIAVTYFFSTSGGETEDVQNVFYGSQPQPYLTSVDDPYDDISPKHTWRIVLTRDQLQARLGSLVKGSYRRVKVVKRGASPRIVQADVIGTRGRTRVTGATLRARLGLDDTWAYFASTTTKVRRPATGPRLNGNGGATAVRSFLARLAAALTRRPSVLYGSVSPRPARWRVIVERRGARGWRTLRRVRTTRTGAYAVKVRAAGLYRVRANGFAGPVVRVP